MDITIKEAMLKAAQSSSSSTSSPKPPAESGGSAASAVVPDETKKLRGEVATLQLQLNDCREEGRRLQLEIKSLREEKDKAESAVTAGGGGANPITDEQITRRFVRLRSDIDALVNNSSWYDLTKKVTLTREQQDNDQLLYIYGDDWNDMEPADRALLLRSEWWDNLAATVLDRSHYGLRDVTGPRDRDLESGLQEFELFLIDEQVRQDKINDWVVQTIECAELTKAEDRGVVTAKKSLFELLELILVDSLGPDSVGDLRDAIEALVEDAFGLRMMMRKSRGGQHTKAINVFDDITFVRNNESWMEVVAVRGGTMADGGNEVEHMIFPALVKKSDGREVVLEKAQVVVRKGEPEIRLS
ncbi:hypothetical protein QBC41DRAFT_371699 [Cercophora samala]|uniref:Uncharacterized protein n=1 Tax=Cercophora samala TaxID=330535 RepID=A0AA39ZI61_9PEZI|nr:hypothetical protein QBC41DRAFT_371699 [Cercophora samala]